MNTTDCPNCGHPTSNQESACSACGFELITMTRKTAPLQPASAQPNNTLTISIVASLTLALTATIGFFMFTTYQSNQNARQLEIAKLEAENKNKERQLELEKEKLKLEKEKLKMQQNSNKAIPNNAPPQQQTRPSAVGYYPQTMTRPISSNELYSMNCTQLWQMRNEIYARYGRPFQSYEVNAYFSAQPWYQRNPNYSDSMLPLLEQQNAATIMNYEKSQGCM